MDYPNAMAMNSNLDANASHLSKAEKDLENALRPDLFDSFAGQKQVVDNLRVFVKAAAQRGEALDHTLLHGPIPCCTALRAWARQRFRTSSRMSWAWA